MALLKTKTKTLFLESAYMIAFYKLFWKYQNLHIMKAPEIDRWKKYDCLHLKNKADGEGVEKREPSCTVGGNVNWYSHYGEQYGGSLKN